MWERKQNERAFESYASADYGEVYHALKDLVGRAESFVEFGSGLGIVTIMADSLGFDARGIEAKESLVELANDYAEQFSSNAKFAAGSFIPDDFDWDPGSGEESVRTFVDVPSAYADLDMQLCDFDLIYAYPWPTEHELYDNIIKQHARPGALYLTYDAREGMNLQQL
jgi:hypothetical protein